MPSQVVSEVKPGMQRSVKTGASIQFHHRIQPDEHSGGGTIVVRMVSWHEAADLEIRYQASAGVALLDGQLQVEQARSGALYPLTFAYNNNGTPVEVTLQVTARLHNGQLDQQSYGVRVRPADAGQPATEPGTVLPAETRMQIRQP